MNLVTASDFDIPPYAIPNLDKVANTFPAFVAEQQEEILLEVLGSNLYTAFSEGLDALPGEWIGTNGTGYSIDDLVVYGNDIWKSLADTNLNNTPEEGVNWTISEDGNRWLLLKNGNTYTYNDKVYRFKGFTKIMKPFIYSKWVEFTFDALTGVGVNISTTENSQPISPATRIIRAWSDFVRNIGGGCEQQDTLYGYLINTNLAEGTFDDTFEDSFDGFQDYLNYWFRNPGLRNLFDL